MTAYAQINGVQIVAARVTFPQFGEWHGDIVLAEAQALSGAVAVTIGDLVLTGYAFRTGPFTGRRSVRVVGGYGGWTAPVEPQTYENPNALLLSTVLGDVAATVGERIALAADRVVGSFFVRERCRASRVLRQLLGDTWWVRPDGVTTDVARDASQIASAFHVINYKPEVGQFVVATEALSDWMPGRTFVDVNVPTVQTISSATIILDNEGVARVEALTNTVAADTGDRLLADLGQIIREQFPALTFLGRYEYSVDAVGAGVVDASPTDTRLGLPSVTVIPETFPLMTADLAVGDLVRVMFVNGDPTRPEVVSAPATSPTITVGDVAPAPVARVGDEVTITSAEVAASGMTSPSGPVTISTPLVCKITSGSTQVQSG